MASHSIQGRLRRLDPRVRCDDGNPGRSEYSKRDPWAKSSYRSRWLAALPALTLNRYLGVQARMLGTAHLVSCVW
jgi:hypothetical protein